MRGGQCCYCLPFLAAPYMSLESDYGIPQSPLIFCAILGMCIIGIVYFHDLILIFYENIKDFSFLHQNCRTDFSPYFEEKKFAYDTNASDSWSPGSQLTCLFSDFVLFSGIDAFSYWLLKLRLYFN